MNAITIAAPAKINLFLEIGAIRKDGRHNLRSLVMFAGANGVADILRLSPASELRLRVMGGVACPDGAENLVLRVARDLRRQAGIAAGADMILTKNIPVAAGLGGGSSDAAAALCALERLWRLDKGLDRQAEFAHGADIPACRHARPCHMSGAGETIIPAHMPDLPVVIVNSGRKLSTRAVFARLDRNSRRISPDNDALALVAADNVDACIDAIAARRNDLTAAACALCPEIAMILQILSRREGVRLARMSGSGSSCFAIFDDMFVAKAAAAALSEQYPRWWVRACLLEGSSSLRRRPAIAPRRSLFPLRPAATA